MTYEFNWDGQLQSEDGGVLPPDSLMRSRYAASLSTHAVRKSSGGDYVLNVNAGWGHGKTYFLKRWFADIKKCHPAVYVNAWKHDFSDDPLLTVVSELRSQLTNQFSLDRIKSKVDVGALIKAGAPLLANAVTKKLIGAGIDDIDEEYQSLAGHGAERLAGLMLQKHEDQMSSVSSFRKELSGLADRITKTSRKHQLPVFVFIDELDRCRPTYAIELLEVVKHLFDVEEFVFVIATDTGQLEHSIKAIYGNGFDAKSYLSRFFSESVTLPRSNLAELFLQNNDFKLLFDYDEEKVFKKAKFDVKSIAEALSELFNDYDIPLRTTFKILSRALFAIDSLEKGRTAIDPLFLLLLLLIRESTGEYYSHLMHTVRPNFSEEPHHITPKKLEQYSIGLIVEPEKLGVFSKSFRSKELVNIKLSELFSLRKVELEGGQSFEKREEDLRKKLSRTRTSLTQNDTYNLCMLYAPDELERLKKHDYNQLVEHAMLLE